MTTSETGVDATYRSIAGSGSVFRADCPSRPILDQIADKWSMMAMAALEEPRRFNEIKRRLEGVTQRVLTRTLRRLERNGMIERVVTSTRPVAVEYRVAPLGRSLQDLIDALLHWTTVTLPAVDRARARFDESG